MPPRSFEHWYRGSSVEAVARSSTAAPWGIRGAFVAPVIRGGSVRIAEASGGLRAGGVGAPAARVFAGASPGAATGGATPARADVRAVGATALEIVATTSPRIAGASAAGGMCSLGGGHVVHATIGAVCEGGVGIAASIDAPVASAPKSVGRWSTGGRSAVAAEGVESLSGGVSIRPGAVVADGADDSGSGGSSANGDGPKAESPHVRSFEYWRRGEAVVDVGPRGGGLARGYRGWLGVPSSGRAGRDAGVDPEGARLRVGGGADGAIRIDRHVVGAASIEPGGAGGSARQNHVAGAGGAAPLGGTARLERGASDRAVVTAGLGGGSGPRLGANLDVTALVGTYSTASPRLAVEVAPAAAAWLGASARVAVDHGLDSLGGDGRIYGGVADAVATFAPAARGGLAVGGGIDRPPLLYKIYVNDGLGGPIDYLSSIAEVSGSEWTSEPLPAGSSFRFGVRAYGPVDGLDENLDAAVALVIDARGRDATRVPRPPVGLRAVDRGGGRVRLEWTTTGPSRFEEDATRFHVYVGPDPVTDFSSPIVVPAPAARGAVVATEIRDLPGGRVVGAIVRAANEFGEDDNVDSIRFAVDLAPPARVEDLVASPAAGV